MEFSTLKIGDLVANVKDDTARNDLITLATRVTNIENAGSGADTSFEGVVQTTGNGVINNQYAYSYIVFSEAVSGKRFILLWGLTASKGPATITFALPMANTDYTVVISDVYNSSTSNAYSMTHSHTTTSFKTVTGASSTARFIVIGELD